MEYAVIIGNGDLDLTQIMEELISAAKIVVCADGGANQAHIHGIIPDWIVGDFDSLNRCARDFFQDRSQLYFQGEQETSDLEKCLNFVLEKGWRQVVLMGVQGTRSDHFFYTCRLLYQYRHLLQVTIINRWEKITLVNDSFKFDTLGQKVSIMGWPFASGVTSYGLKYPLTDVCLDFDQSFSLSNEVEKVPARIEINVGAILVFQLLEEC